MRNVKTDFRFFMIDLKLVYSTNIKNHLNP